MISTSEGRKENKGQRQDLIDSTVFPSYERGLYINISEVCSQRNNSKLA